MKAHMKALLKLLTLLALFSAPRLASGYYDPGVQRWVNRDPIGDPGPKMVRNHIPVRVHHFKNPGEYSEGSNLYRFVRNDSLDGIDPLGLELMPPAGPTSPIGTPGAGSYCKVPGWLCRAGCWAAAAAGASLTCPESGPGAVACVAAWAAAASICSDACPP
jgi:hypothetical protein